MSLIAEQLTGLAPETEPMPQRQKQQTRFLVRQQFADRHVVVPDIHGEHKVLERIINKYDNEPDIGFVFLGDVLDRKGLAPDTEKGVFQSLELIRQLGSRAVMTMANHEWLFHAASSASDSELKKSLTNDWLGTTPDNSVEQNVLSAYDMDPLRRDQSTSRELSKRMARVGHLAILNSASPYYETERFIATHAGIMPGVAWDLQRNYLTEVAKEMDEGLFYDRPPQWFSMKLATSIEPIIQTDKVVISGHAHVLGKASKRFPDQRKERSLHDGRRIRLASTLNAPSRAPAFVWQDWDGKVVKIRHPEGAEE